MSGVQAGVFTINDMSDLFDLQTPEGRRAAARWMSETLTAVRPCWDNARDDRTHYVVDLLYDDLRKDDQAAIDAAAAQDRWHHHWQLHALSPEAQARRDEDDQLHAATAGPQTVSADQGRQLRAGGRPWIAIESFTVDRIEREPNGPHMSVDFKARIRNVGAAPTAEISTDVDVMSFTDVHEHTWSQRRINACEAARDSGKYEPNRIERALAPGEEVSLGLSNSNRDVFLGNNNIVYGDDESDYMVAIGCISYSLGSSDQRGTATFAYVFGKKANGNLLRIGRKDGVMLGKTLKWLSLHQDYEQ